MTDSKLKYFIGEAEAALYQLIEALQEKVEQTLNAHDDTLDWFDEPTPLVAQLQEMKDLYEESSELLDEANEAVKEVYDIAEMLEKLNSLDD